MRSMLSSVVGAVKLPLSGLACSATRNSLEMLMAPSAPGGLPPWAVRRATRRMLRVRRLTAPCSPMSTLANSCSKCVDDREV